MNEWECIDLKCSHYDGDECTLGACLDPPDPQPPVCKCREAPPRCVPIINADCPIHGSRARNGEGDVNE